MDERPTFWSSLAEHWHIARTLRGLRIHFDPEKCTGDWLCYEVCPVGCWTPDRESRRAIFHDLDRCIACGACALQCPGEAIELRQTGAWNDIELERAAAIHVVEEFKVHLPDGITRLLKSFIDCASESVQTEKKEHADERK